MIIDPVTIGPRGAYRRRAATDCSGTASPGFGGGRTQAGGHRHQPDLRFETNLNQKVREVMTKERLVTAKVGITWRNPRPAP